MLPARATAFAWATASSSTRMIVDGLWDVFNQYHMGVTAENVAASTASRAPSRTSSRVASQQKAEAAQKAGRFKDEIVPVEIPQRKGDAARVRHRRISQGTARTLEALAGLKPGVRQGRHGDRGQRLGHQRRRRRGAS